MEIMKSCIFCHIKNRDIISEGSFSIAFYDKYPVNPGHVLVVSKRHISEYLDLSSEEKEDMWKLVDIVTDILKEKYAPHGYNIGINIGKTAGQTIFHCHIHIIPRYEGDMDFPEGGVRGVIPEKQKYL